MHYHYTIKQMRDKIRCPQLGDAEYGEWGSFPLKARLVIDDLIQMVENRDRFIEDIRRQNNGI